MKRIGIYSGTFDPVHTGHVAFALQAVEAARLDALYFMPERCPRRDKTPEHFGHRVAMLYRAVRPHRKLRVIEVTSRTFTITKTLPELKKIFPSDQLVFIFGSDIVGYKADWPYFSQLKKTAEFCIGLREGAKEKDVEAELDRTGIAKSRRYIIKSYASAVSSTKIRSALSNKRTEKGLLTSVHRYAKEEWLYL